MRLEDLEFIRDSRGHRHDSLKKFYEFMIMITAYRCKSHGPDVLAHPVTLESVGLQVSQGDEELRQNHRWGWPWSRVLETCKLCFNLP